MVYHLKIRCTSTFFSFVNEGSGWLKRILVCKSTLWVFVYQSVYIIGQTMAALNSWDKIMWIPIYGKRGSNQKPLEHEPTKSDDMWNGSKTYKTRPSALGMSDPVMESLRNSGNPRILKFAKGRRGRRWKRWKSGEKRWKTMKNYEKVIKTVKNDEKLWKTMKSYEKR